MDIHLRTLARKTNDPVLFLALANAHTKHVTHGETAEYAGSGLREMGKVWKHEHPTA